MKSTTLTIRQEDRPIVPFRHGLMPSIGCCMVASGNYGARSEAAKQVLIEKYGEETAGAWLQGMKDMDAYSAEVFAPWSDADIAVAHSVDKIATEREPLPSVTVSVDFGLEGVSVVKF